MSSFTNCSKILLKYAKELMSKYKVDESVRLLGIRIDELKKEEDIKKNDIFNYFKNVEKAKKDGF
jgi:hypothetical protein